MLICVPGIRLRYVQQQNLLAVLRDSKAEPVGVIRCRDVKRLRDLLIERRSAIPRVIVLDRFRRNQRNRRRADLLAGTAIQFNVIKSFFVKFPIQIGGRLWIILFPNSIVALARFGKRLPGIDHRPPLAVRADMQRHVVLRDSKAEPIRIATA